MNILIGLIIVVVLIETLNYFFSNNTKAIEEEPIQGLFKIVSVTREDPEDEDSDTTYVLEKNGKTYEVETFYFEPFTVGSYHNLTLTTTRFIKVKKFFWFSSPVLDENGEPVEDSFFIEIDEVEDTE